MTNHRIGHQPVLSRPSGCAASAPMSDNGQGARHPPRNSVVSTLDAVIMLMYSAR